MCEGWEQHEKWGCSFVVVQCCFVVFVFVVLSYHFRPRLLWYRYGIGNFATLACSGSLVFGFQGCGESEAFVRVSGR